MERNSYGLFFRFIQGFVRVFYPKYKVRLPEELNGPVVYITHHQNLFGPFVTLLWFPRTIHAWILHVFLDREECFKQYTDYTFSKRFGWNKTLAKMCAFPISFFISKLLKSGKGIPVYRNSRKIMQTMKTSVSILKQNKSVIIFPDIDYADDSAVVKEMYLGFLNLEKYYYKETGKHICFVPLFVSKNKKQIVANSQIFFKGVRSFKEERDNVYQQIQENLNNLAQICEDT